MNSDPQTFDLVVIGSGPAGYRAAVQAAKMKKSVAIIEKTPGQLGGTWIHTGTIPSKSLRESMEAIHSIKFHAGAQWVERIIQDLPAQKLAAQAAKVAKYEENIVRRYLSRYNITLIEGEGSLIDPHTVQVIAPTRTIFLKAQFVLLGTGSRPRRPKEIPCDGWRVVDADQLLSLTSLPKSLIIYGGGVIGCEYACIFRSLGVDTTIVDSRPTIMQYVDQETAMALKASMEGSGIKFRLGVTFKSIYGVETKASLAIEGEAPMTADLIFYAGGRSANTENLGLESLGIQKSTRGEILVNEHFQTAVPNIYAAGDVIGAPALAATSAAQGRHAARHMFGAKVKSFPQVFPVGIYTIPELSSVGATEQELAKKGVDYVVGRAHYYEIARGYIRGDDHGLLKMLVCRQTHRILGIHILGYDACNLVHIGLAFMQKGGTAQDLVDMVFNYPTLAEAYRIAAFNALNKIFPEGDIGEPPTF